MKSRVAFFWPAAMVMGLAVVYAVAFSWFSIARAHNFNAGWYDLGIMTQTVWRVAHGFGFTFSNPEAGSAGAHGVTMWRTAIHTDYLLLFLAPLGWIKDHVADGLLIVQSVVLAAGAWFVYRIAQRVLGSSWMGVFLTAVYLNYAPLQFANLFEFHAVTLSGTFFLAAADAILRNRHRQFWIWAALALITKEQVGITLGLVAAWLYWRQARQPDGPGMRRRAWMALVICWGWVFLQMFVVIPLSRPGQAGNFTYVKFYQSSGSDASTIAADRLTLHSLKTHVLTRTHLNDLKMLLTPVGVIPALHPILLVAIPEMLIYWLSDSPNQQTLFLHYHALFIPIIFLAAIFGWRWLAEIFKRRWDLPPRWANMVLVVLVLWGSTMGVLRSSPWPWSPLSRWPLVAWKEALAPEVQQALQLVPERASVALTQNLGPLLAERPVVKLLPAGAGNTDYIVILERKFDPTIPTNDKRLAERVMLDQLKAWIEASGSYERLFAHERVLVFKRNEVPSLPLPVWPTGLLGQ